MNEGIRVNKFERRRKRQQSIVVVPQRLSRRNRQDRPNTFPLGQQAVSHGFVEFFGITQGPWKALLQKPVNPLTLLI